MVDVVSLSFKADSREVKQANKDLDNLGKTSKGVTSSMTALKTAFAALGIGLVARQAVDATLSMQRINSTLRVATGSSEGAADAMAFLRNESERLGLAFETSATQFGQLAAAAKGTALEGEAARDIFVAISEASTAMGLSADQAGGALTAIQQIISKGTVSAEELRGQLGERLPGAFQIAARSIGVTTQELGKMLENGELMAEDLLPALASELRATFGGEAEAMANGLQASINRLNNAFFDLMAQGSLPGATNAIGELTTLIKDPAFQEGFDLLVTGFFSMAQTTMEAATGLAEFARFAGEEIAAVTGDVAGDDIVRLEQRAEQIKELMSGGMIDRVRFFGKDGFVEYYDDQELQAELSRVQGHIDAFYANQEEKASQRQPVIDIGAAPEQTGRTQQRTSARDLERAQKEADRELERRREEQQREAERRQRDAARLYQETRTEMELLNQEYSRLDEMLSRGDISWDTYSRAVLDASEAMDALEEANEETSKQMEDMWEQAAKNMQTAMSDFFFDVMQGEIGDLGNSFKTMIDRMVAEKLASGLFDSASGFFGEMAGGGGAGGFLGDVFSGLFNFEGGGFTGSGSRVGGIDGKGGFMAVVHPDETVVDHKKGQNTGGNVSVNINVNGVRDEGGLSRAAGRVAAEAGAALARQQRRNG